MRVSDLDLLFVPATGLLSSDHWIERWSGKLSTAQRVEAGDPSATVSRLVVQAQAATRPAVLIGHSTGVVAAALAAPALAAARLRGAFLVAPPDEPTLRTLDGGQWPPLPRAPLPFPAVLVASANAPWAPLAESQALAQAWGAEFIDAGEAGRIDDASGHGPWPDGLLKLAAFLKKLS